LTLLAGLFTFVVGHDLLGAMSRLTTRMSSVAEGNFDGEIPEIGRRDEVGAIARALLVLRDNSREAAELRQDVLTGLPTRKLLMDRLNQAMSASARSGNYGGVMLVDMDRFKALNDTQGHDVGDILLRQVAGRLKACVREGDTVARLGSDEFVLLLGDLGQKVKESAAIVEGTGEKVLTALNLPFQLGRVAHMTSASIGLTLFKGDAGTAEETLKQADLAMYQCKESGRNAWRFFDPEMEATVRKRAALEADLRRALAADQFVLYYQPVIGSDGTLKGAEALLRWIHPERGLVPPDAFIPLAEETGLILPLGEWVLETACKQLVKWAARPETANLRIAVNVSPRQFQKPEFVEETLMIIQSIGANPHRLELELTESLLVQNVDEIIAEMHALQSKGVAFSLDDFGTGYSSLSYLKRMPLNTLKIDRSFVRDVLTDANAATIAKTVVALACSLGLGIIAEGVETVEQLDFLAASGCDAYQGYLFSRPLPIEGFEQFLVRLDALDPLSRLLSRKGPASVPISSEREVANLL
jgi:diguanylate cyclase (GGDEF)-like protein